MSSDSNVIQAKANFFLNNLSLKTVKVLIKNLSQAKQFRRFQVTQNYQMKQQGDNADTLWNKSPMILVEITDISINGVEEE